MNRLVRAVLRLFAAPRVNMREDYERVRKLQRQLAARPIPRYRALDLQIRSADGSRQIPVRVFHPKEQQRDEVLLFLHGGGWVTGDIESYTPACATMADLTGCVVVSVDYRLAPEHPFPAGLEDCLRVTRVLLAQPQRVGATDPDRIVLVGDSAGGNLAAVVSQVLRGNTGADSTSSHNTDIRHVDGERSPSRQILLYPVTHWNHDPETSPFASVRNHGDDYRLTNTEVQDYLELYVPDPERRRDPLVAPLMADDLSNQPRTLMITADLDLLRDEGEAYAAALAEAGNTVETIRVEGALHGFISLPRFSRSLRSAYEKINAFLDEEPA